MKFGVVGDVRRWLLGPRRFCSVEPVLFVFMFASFLSFPLFQQLLWHRLCETDSNCTLDSHGNHSDPPSTVLSKASSWILYTNLASGLPSIFVSLFYGSLSDHIGRKPFIYLPALGAVVNAAVCLLVIYFPNVFPLPFLLLGAVTTGLYGTFTILNFAVYAYISDVSGLTARTVQITILESMTYLAAGIANLIGGVWIKSGDFSSPYWFILSCNLAVIVYMLVAVPESLVVSQTRQNSSTKQVQSTRPQRMSNCDLLKSVGKKLLLFLKLLLTNWRLSVLMTMFFVVEINFLGISDVVVLYSIKYFDWKPDRIGYFLAMKVLFNFLAAFVVLPLLVRVLKFQDTVVLMMGLASGAAALVLMGLATKTWIMFTVPVVGAMRGCVVPVIRAMLSKQVPPDAKGVLFSGVSIVEAACLLLASVVYNKLFPATYHIHHGFCFFLMAASVAIPFSLTVILHFTSRRTQPPPAESQPLLQNSNSH